LSEAELSGNFLHYGSVSRQQDFVSSANETLVAQVDVRAAIVNRTERPGYRGVLNRKQPAKFGDLQGAFGYSGSRNFCDLPDDLEMSSIRRRGRHDILRKEHSLAQIEPR
jgi:uncharacterized protein CbrC (UPF0167 family)